jgi:Flp pilus assembly protein TadD
MSIGLIVRVVNRYLSMFLMGETIKNIKSMCMVEYGNYFIDKGAFGKAMVYYRKALKYNTNNYYACGGLAATLLENKEYEDALEQCKKAISLKNTDPELNILIAVIYESKGMDGLFKEQLDHILKLCTGDEAAVYNRMAYTYRRLNRYKEAEQYIKKAIKVEPHKVAYHNNLASIYLYQNDLSGAKDEYQKVIDLAKTKEDKRFKKYATYHLKEIEMKTGEE